MPRIARRFKRGEYMHLIVRGIGRQALFEDEDDFRFFLTALERFSQDTEVQILAYCLMENHVHLLVHDPAAAVSLMMKKIGVSYAYHYNQKYDRVGHLFQNRFLSEVIDSSMALVRVFRYILNNPYKAGICPANRYRWSSYSLYDTDNTFLETGILRELLGDFSQMESFLCEENDDIYMEDSTPRRDDKWAKKTIFQTLEINNGTILAALEKSERNKALRKLKNAGLTIRQIERLTGISRSIIHRA